MLPQYIAKQFIHLENVQETVPIFLDKKGEMLPEGAEKCNLQKQNVTRCQNEMLLKEAANDTCWSSELSLLNLIPKVQRTLVRIFRDFQLFCLAHILNIFVATCNIGIGMYNLIDFKFLALLSDSINKVYPVRFKK